MAPVKRPTDPRIPETLKHIRQLAKRHDRRIVVQDYLHYRQVHAPHLPSMTTLYNIFGSWREALSAAGVDQSSTELSRTDDQTLIAALQLAAKNLNTEVLSSHAYDDWRRQQLAKTKDKSKHPPSSSVIRKWLGPWAAAVQRASLQTTERAAPRKPTMIEVIDALRRAKGQISGMMTPRTYNDFRTALPEEERAGYPELAQIIGPQFPSWEAALRAADVEQSDSVHPTALWTAEEARRIVKRIEQVTKRPITEADYENVKARSKKIMPPWSVVVDLLSL